MSESDYRQSSSTGSTFTAFLIGGLIGGAIALLYAPRSGQERANTSLMRDRQEPTRSCSLFGPRKPAWRR